MTTAINYTSWVKELQQLPQSLPSELTEWLLEQGFITGKAREKGAHMQVTLLTNEWQMPWPWEENLLTSSTNPREGQSIEKQCLIREICMEGNREPWWFARTVIPEATLNDHGKQLLSLGTMPIGEFLFKQPDLVRTPFDFALIKPEQVEFQHIHQFGFADKTSLWARRSVFHFDHKQLLLTEVFLPSFIAWLQNHAK